MLPYVSRPKQNCTTQHLELFSNTKNIDIGQFLQKKSRLEAQQNASSRVGAMVFSWRELPKKQLKTKLHISLIEILHETITLISLN